MCSILLFCSFVRPKELTYVPEQLKTWLFLSLVFNAGACISKPHLISLLEHGKEPWEAEGEGTRSTLQGENVRCRWKTCPGNGLAIFRSPSLLTGLPRNPSWALRPWLRIGFLFFLPSCLCSKLFCTKETVLVPFRCCGEAPWQSRLKGDSVCFSVWVHTVAHPCGNSQWHDHEQPGTAESEKCMPVTQLAFSTHIQSGWISTSVQTSKGVPHRHAHEPVLSNSPSLRHLSLTITYINKALY